MLLVLYSVLAISAVIVFGHVLKEYFLKEDLFWRRLDDLTYYFLFPTLLLHNTANAAFSISDAHTAAYVTILATFAMSAFILITQAIMQIDGALFSSLFQGAIRYNAYVFISFSEFIFGEASSGIANLIAAYMVIVTNLLSIFILTFYGEGRKIGVKGILMTFAQNPLIGAVILGTLLRFWGIKFEGPLNQMLEYISDAAVPLGLMSVGANLILIIHPRRILPTLYATSMKMFGLPLLTFIIVKAIGTTGIVSQIAVLYALAPCTSNAFVLARQMGGDSEAVASVISWTSLLSPFLVFFVFGILWPV